MSTASRTAGARAASTGPAGGATTSRNVRAAPGCGGRGARGCSESGGARATWGPPYSARPCVVNTARSASILQLRAGGSRTRASLSSPASGAALAARRRGVTRRRRGAPRFDPAQRRARAEGGHTGPPHTKQRAEKHDHDPHGAPSTPSRPRQSAALPGRLRVGSGWHCDFCTAAPRKFPFRCRHRSPNRRLARVFTSDLQHQPSVLQEAPGRSPPSTFRSGFRPKVQRRATEYTMHLAPTSQSFWHA